MIGPWLIPYAVGFACGCAFVWVAQLVALRWVVRRLQRQNGGVSWPC